MNNPLLAAMALASRKYIDYYRAFSDDFRRNGELELVRKCSQFPVKNVFDVGSNIGDWALMARRHFPDATLHTFELAATTFETLSARVKGPNFVLNNVGLADSTGSITYKDYGINSTVNTLSLETIFWDDKRPHTLVKAPVITGDDYCKKYGITFLDFLKIDVEGAESLVLKGCSGLLAAKAIRLVQFEYGYANADQRFLMRDFYQLFEGLGYQVARLTKRPIEFAPWTYSNNDFRSGPNYLAVRRGDTELIAALSR
jgi:FkbM family methyltransferase